MKNTRLLSCLATLICTFISFPLSIYAQTPLSAESTATTKTSTTQDTYPRRNDLQTSRRDDDQKSNNWEGSFAVNNSDTRIKIGGFVELDIIHDNDAIQSKGQFIANSIPTANSTLAGGADGQTSFSLSPSRLYFETRTPIEDRRIKTFVSLDMYDDELGLDASPRLRQAYFEISNILYGGDLLFGQAWSTTTDLESTPDVLDFRGSDSLFGQLQPQLRWSKSLTESIRLMLALETPDNHIVEGADVLTRWPDGVIAVTWDRSRFNLMTSLVVKDLRASHNNETAVSDVGFGGSLSGKFTLPYGDTPDYFMFSATFGKGIGSHFNNAQADAVYDTTRNELKTISLYGVTLGYRLSWSQQLSSTLVYCCIEIDNHPAQAPESVKGTEYSSGNLVWHADQHWLIGIEGIWGKREDNNDEEGTVFRTQFTTRLSF